jgi:uncharacterized phage-associated protein
MLGFDVDKTIQASAYLIKRQPEHVENYMRLLKLLYLADRLSLKERLSPICGDVPYAMRRGPVPSATYNLIKGRDPASDKWDRFIERINYDVRLKVDPGNRKLSRAELNILERVAERFRAYDEWALVHWCHRNIPEYKKNWRARGKRAYRRIPLEDVLAEIGRAGDQAKIVDQLNASAGFAHLFGDHTPTTAE